MKIQIFFLFLLLFFTKPLLAYKTADLNAWAPFESKETPVKLIDPETDKLGLIYERESDKYLMDLGAGLSYCEKIEGFPVCPLPAEAKKLKLISSYFPFAGNSGKNGVIKNWREDTSQISVPGVVESPGGEKGLQISGLGGSVVENVRGVKIGVHDRNYETITGIQLGLAQPQAENEIRLGTVSSPPKKNGMQIGIINYTSKKQGLNFGVANIIYEGEDPLFPVVNATIPF